MKDRKKPRRRKPQEVRASGNTPDRPKRYVRWPLVAVVLCLLLVVFCFFGVPSIWRTEENWLDSIRLPDNGSPASSVAESRTPDGAATQPAQIRTLIEETTGAVERLVERFPDDVASVALSAQVRHRSGDAVQAVKLWKRCLERNPGFMDAYLGIASVFIERGEYDQAQTVLMHALFVEPGSTQAVILLANALMNQGKLEETVTLLESNIATSPPAMPSFLLLGQAYLQLRQYDRAKQCFTSAVQLAPEFPNAYYGLSTACARLGQKQESVEHSKKFKELDAQERQVQLVQARRSDDVVSQAKEAANTYLVAGRIYYAAGDVSQAEAQWRKAADHDPDNVACREEILRLCQQQGRTQDALEMEEQLREIQQRR